MFEGWFADNTISVNTDGNSVLGEPTQINLNQSVQSSMPYVPSLYDYPLLSAACAIMWSEWCHLFWIAQSSSVAITEDFPVYLLNATTTPTVCINPCSIILTF